MSEIELKETADEFIKSTPSNTNSIQHFAEIHAGSGSESLHVTSEGQFMGAETYADAKFKVNYSGVLSLIDGIITGGTIQTATTGYRIRLNGSNGKIELMNGSSVLGSIYCDSGGSIIIDTVDDIYLTKGGVNRWRFNSDGNLNFSGSGGAITWASGRKLTDASDHIQVDGGIAPDSDVNHFCGSNSRRWNEVHSHTINAAHYDGEDFNYLDEFCPICGETFEENDVLAPFVYKKLEDKVATIPCHLRCATKNIVKSERDNNVQRNIQAMEAKRQIRVEKELEKLAVKQ